MRPERKTNDSRFRASTLVELVVALTALTIIVLGQSIAGYNARLDIQKSRKRSTAATTALLLSESWVGAGGATTYDPVAGLASQLAITAGTGPEAPVGFTSRGSYSIVIDGLQYGATLSSQELASSLRALNVTIRWSDRDGVDPSAFSRDFCLTTYVLLD